MAWTNWGFDGTINEAQWSQMAGLLGNDYVAAGNGDCVVTAVAGARSVSVAAGTLYGDGVVSVNSAPEVVAMTTPVNGQWYVIALRRTWATNVSALVAIAGATTTTTTPTAPPTSFPTLNTQPGVLTDQPIAWAWCNSANTNVVVYDIRKRAVKSMPPVVANAAERDAKFMTPTQGLQVWRDDIGAVETYYGLYNAITNKGGRDVAGWYTDTRAMGLVPIKPSVISVAGGGTGTVNSLGAIAVSNGTILNVDNVFSSAYRNYKIIISGFGGNSGNAEIYFRLRSAGVDSGVNYYASGVAAGSAGLGHRNQVNQSTFQLGVIAGSGVYNTGEIELRDPANTILTTYLSRMGGSTATAVFSNHDAGFHNLSTAYDGFTIIISAGVFSASTIQIFGYND